MADFRVHVEEANRKKRLQQHHRLFFLLSLAAGLIFLQGYMIAPLIPRLAEIFQVPEQEIGFIVPVYMLAYALAALFYGLLSDRFGRWPVMRASVFIFILCTALTATAQSASQIAIWRLLTGLGASGVIPLTFALIGDLFPFRERGQMLGMVFAYMEGGMAFGSAGGAMLEPFVGWRILFIATSVVAAIILWRLHSYELLFDTARGGALLSVRQVFTGYRSVLSSWRGQRTYAYVFLNAIFHSGVYTWLGLYLSQRYNLGVTGIGLAIFGYGIPGLLLSPIIGKAVDRWGRRWLIPPGLGMAAVAGFMMIFQIPLNLTTVAILVLSLGYDLTQPLFAGIVTDLGTKRSLGQTMGLKVFTLFTGFGIGSLVFGEVLRWGFGSTLAIFSAIQLLAAVVAIPLFWSEVPKNEEQIRAAEMRDEQEEDGE
ncbi:MFS transporter [Nostocales cyanobacterium LEGE 11386]|nr:MFS transporter [Nostocales cyanobacterium LEGE 11386]